MPATLDLLGHPIDDTIAPVPPGVPKKRKTVPKGYAAPPGSGPAGEKCNTCAHFSGRMRSRRYLKCELMRAHWTGGPGTDIRARSPACARWQSAHTLP